MNTPPRQKPRHSQTFAMSKGVEELQTKLTGLVEELDHKVFRPEQKVAFQCSATCCDLRGPQGEMAQWYVRPGTTTMLVQKNPNLAHVNTTV
mmetsp:Transcript_46583/g.74480  ORF Transcript_46583/g.74480 Transcript_46583/m.74480 type:complete len:92 (-) Transcript_46583:992-1267(-)